MLSAVPLPSRAAAIVPLVMSPAAWLCVAAALPSNAVCSPLTVEMFCVPVCVDRSRSWASVAFAVAPVAMVTVSVPKKTPVFVSVP